MPYRLAVLLAASMIAACATGGRSGRDAGTGLEDVASMDSAVDARLAADAPSTDDTTELDGGTTDAAVTDTPGLDAPNDTPRPIDAPADTPPDVPRDAPTATACTAGTAGAVCGGRPCVDGYCCDALCGSACDSCAITGREGLCTIATGIACDDADGCTYGETCGSGGACGGGARIACDAMDTACRDFSCNGTSSCGSAPRAVGTPCDDGNGATTADACRADGACAGTSAGCTMPVDACATGTQNRDRCAGARVMGRTEASSTTGYRVTGTTCTASNRFDDCSWDAGYDHAYRIWMRSGETFSATLSRINTCYSGWSATLKLYESTGCSDVTCSGDRWCRDFVNSSAQNYTAVRDGWIVLVVDGSTAFDDEGQYTLTVRLTGCAAPGCGC